VEVPVLSIVAGMFDPAIEWYHRNPGLANGGRDLYVQDIVPVVLTLDNKLRGPLPFDLRIGDVC
jgi:hypothetical protein